MFQVIISGIIALAFLMIANHFSKKKIIKGELSRKIPHIVFCIMVAFWPLFISMRAIAIINLLFVVLTWITIKLNLFFDSRKVDRISQGEYFLVIGSSMAALLNPPGWIFAAALLNVGLADAAAALVGTKWGNHTKKIFGQTKSLEGSLAFIIVSVVILTTFFIVTPLNMQYALLVISVLPILTAGVEFVSPYGIDNLLIPTVITLSLMWSQVMV